MNKVVGSHLRNSQVLYPFGLALGTIPRMLLSARASASWRCLFIIQNTKKKYSDLITIKYTSGIRRFNLHISGEFLLSNAM